jgi:hypothetical protein
LNRRFHGTKISGIFKPFQHPTGSELSITPVIQHIRPEKDAKNPIQPELDGAEAN